MVEDALFNIAGEDHSLKREDGNDGDALGKTKTMETLLGRRKQWRHSWEDGDGDTLGKTEMEMLLRWGDGNTSCRYRNYNSTSNITRINQNYVTL